MAAARDNGRTWFKLLTTDEIYWRYYIKPRPDNIQTQTLIDWIKSQGLTVTYELRKSPNYHDKDLLDIYVWTITNAQNKDYWWGFSKWR